MDRYPLPCNSLIYKGPAKLIVRKIIASYYIRITSTEEFLDQINWQICNSTLIQAGK